MADSDVNARSVTGPAKPVRQVAAHTTLEAYHSLVNVDASAARNITLPSCAAADGQWLTIRRDGGSTVTIKVATSPGTDTYSDTEASTDRTLDTDGAAIVLWSVGSTEWKVVGTEGTVT